MNARPLLYDLTRLTGRLFDATPNGIDRVDFAYANRFLGRERKATPVSLSLGGPALFDPAVSDAVLERLHCGWEEPDTASDAGGARFETLRKIETWLQDKPRGGGGAGVGRIQAPRPARDLRKARSAYFGLATKGKSLRRDAPRNAIYLNVSQFPLWSGAYVRWLDARPDIACVAMIHDLLPLQYPEYFLPLDRERHEKRLAFLARRGAAAIVSTSAVETALRAHLESIGRADLPILAAHLPVDKVFTQPIVEEDGVAASAAPYFVMCGTIEPRKNHVMMLNVWRELAAAMGGACPRLIIVGRRGWEIEGVLDLLERCERLRPHVLEVNGLSTLELRALLAGARALLSPSFAEGFGLPIAEAAAGGIPVVASDIPVFREIGGPDLVYVHPLDGPGWRRTILAGMERRLAVPAPGRYDHDAYFGQVESFLAGL